MTNLQDAIPGQKAQNLSLFGLARDSAQELPSVPHWTVSELTSRIRGVVEPFFTQVWVQGEVSNYRPASSGHAYFSLKDQNSCIAAAVFGWGARKKAFELKDGLQLLCRGKIALYPPRGTYQLIIEHMEPLGAGALQIAFEQLKKKLAAEGLFDEALKKAMPRFPVRVAIVTSPSGAAVQDMLTILKRRASHIHIRVIPAVVQGEDAPAQIIRGIEIANRFQLGDLLVLARGGGSIEDLACFNHEGLARAIRASQLPVISAVGHEIDFTIADFVADLRAPTPSAAAEIVSGHWVDAVQRVRDSSLRVQSHMTRHLSTRRVLLSHIIARVISPKDRLREQAQKVDDLTVRLGHAVKMRVDRKKHQWSRTVGQLDALSPLKVLERGYVLLRDPQNTGNQVIKSANEVFSGQKVEVRFHDGERIFQAL